MSIRVGIVSEGVEMIYQPGSKTDEMFIKCSVQIEVISLQMKPIFDQMSEAIQATVDAFSRLWYETIKPAIEFFIERFVRIMLWISIVKRGFPNWFARWVASHWPRKWLPGLGTVWRWSGFQSVFPLG
jgi:hypothetical protein